MSTEETGPGGSQPSEEELRAAYEAEIKKIRIEQILLENVITLVNLGMRRTGLAPGTEDERDPDQVRIAIEAVRALLPLTEQVAPGQAKPIQDALSQLQLAFVRIGGKPGAGSEPAPEAPGGPGVAPAGPGVAPAGPGVAPAGPGVAPESGAGEPAPGPASEGAKPGEPGPAQRSGRLWVPGQ